MDPFGLGWRTLMFYALQHPLYNEFSNEELQSVLRTQIDTIIKEQADVMHSILRYAQPIYPSATAQLTNDTGTQRTPFGTLNLVALGTLLRGGIVGGYVLDSTPPRSLGFPPRPLNVIPLQICLQRFIYLHQTFTSAAPTPKWINAWASPISQPLSPDTNAFNCDSPPPKRPRQHRHA